VARILVVDESAAMRRLLRLMLKGHDVVEARFGVEGLGEIARGPIDLIICDVGLTDMDANEFHRRLMSEAYFGKVLFLAAQLDAMPRDRFGSRLPVLYKPVDAEVLFAKVKSLLATDAPSWDVK